LESLKETGKLMEERSMKYDKIFALRLLPAMKYEGWNFNSGNYFFTTDTK